MSQYKFENPHQLSDRQLWLLATSGMLSQLNRQRHDTLLPFGDEKVPAMQKDVKLCLERDWEITSLEGLSDTMMYLHDKVTFKADQDSWELMSEPELRKASTMHSLGDYRNVLDMVMNYQFNLPQSDTGWHYGRCSWLIRMSAFVNYISEEEAWSLLEENGERIRSAFSSWEEFGISYMVGAQYWRRGTYTAEAVRRYTRHFLFLLTNTNSPWKHVKWEVR